MSATDVGWAPPGGVKDNKEENDALPWKGVAIATLSVEQETSAELEIGLRLVSVPGRFFSKDTEGKKNTAWYLLHW